MKENDYKIKQIELRSESEMHLLKIISIIKDNGSIIAFLPYFTKDNNRIDFFNDLILNSVKKYYPNSCFQWEKKLFFKDEEKEIISSLFPVEKEIFIYFKPDLSSQNILNYINYQFKSIEFTFHLRINNRIENEFFPNSFILYYPIEITNYLDALIDNIIII